MFAKAEDLERSRKFGEMVKRSSFVVRLFTLYVPVWLLMFVALMILVNETNGSFLFVKDIFSNFGNNFSTLFLVIIYVGLWATIIPYFVERSNRKWRREHGWSIYKSVEEDYQRMLKEQELKLEHEAKKNLGIDEASGVVDKTDIRYWHGLLEDGIISEEEFEKKKAELI